MNDAPIVTRPARTPLRFTAISIFLAAGIFLNDLVLLHFARTGGVPIAGGVPYVALVMVSLWFRDRGYVILLGVVSTVLTLVGLVTLAVVADVAVTLGEVVNRLLAIFAIWMTTLLCLQHKRAEQALQEAHSDLERKVEERTAELRAANELLEGEVTEHKRTQQQSLQQQEELAHMSRLSTMGEMATGLAHELNQPLTSIVNYTQGCVRRIQTGDVQSSELVAALNEVSTEAARAGEIIRRMRRFIRKREPHRAEVDLAELVEQILALMGHELQMNNIGVQVHVPATLPAVYADRIQLQQVVVNLLRNSMEAMESIQKDRRRIAISATLENDGGITLAISDSGCGLPTENPEKVFEAFYTTKPEGTGMGLAISRTIIAAHGGCLLAERNPEGGSTFKFTLPVMSTDQ